MAVGADVRGIMTQLFGNALVPGTTVAEAVTVTNNATGAYSAVDGAPITPSTVVCNAIIRPYTLHEINRSDGLMREGDVEIMFNGPDLTGGLEPNHTVTHGAIVYRIMRVRDQRLDGAILLYRAQGRRIT